MRLCGASWLLSLLWLCPIVAASAQTRAVSARIAQIQTPIAQLQNVEVRLHWPEGADEGALSMRVGLLEVPAFGQRFEHVDWQCPLRREQGWQCDGPVRGSGVQSSLRLAVDVSDAVTNVQLSDGQALLRLRRDSALRDVIGLDLIQVPLIWLQSWLARLWPSAQLGEGQLSGQARIMTSAAAPLQAEAAFTLSGAALETDSGEIAAAGVGLQAELTVSMDAHDQRIALRGTLTGGEALLGAAYLALPDTPITLELLARQKGDTGWQLPNFIWRDGDVLDVRAALGFTADATLDSVEARVRSDDLTLWPERYLSGWLGLAGLGGLTTSGALDVRLSATAAGMESVDARLKAVNLHDAQERFALEGLDGHLIHAATGRHGGELRWHSGSVGGVAFGPAHWPLQSSDGLLQLTAAVEVDVLDGHVRLEPLRLRPPRSGQGLQLDFGLYLHQLNLGMLSTALGWPAFRGQLTGSIPAARYHNGWLDLDGGLSMAIFDGRIDVTALVMERPFGVAPTLSLDLTLMNLDLMAITEVFDFGSISGRLDGRIDGLRLVDWSPTAFASELHTVPRRGVRQRISQRAVQDISSVGGASFMQSLQGRLIGLFDDFGYRRIGIGCRLLNEVCSMSGLHSAGIGFTIIEGVGLPRLDVIGFNREVDWPTLVERLAQIADGAAPVVQ